MTAIVWDQLGERVYEAGVDRGVLYFPGGGGVAWNGLLGVEVENTAEVEAVHYDGKKINDLVTPGDFSATLRAWTYPDEFLEFEGMLEDQTGFYVDNQPQSHFHLSYRTMIGDDVNGLNRHYKIHLLWNLTAIPSAKAYETLSDEPDPTEFEWTLTAVPEEIEGFRPTAHFVIDTRKVDPDLLADVEEILYGSDGVEPRLPSLKGLTTFIRKWDRLIITDNFDGTWTASSSAPGVITMLDATTFQITTDDENVEWLDADTYRITSSDKNDEDIY